MSEEDNYTPLFELGIKHTKTLTPVVKVLGDFTVNDTLLSLLLTTLCEYNINKEEEENQIEYEKQVTEQFNAFMQKRFDLNVLKQHY